MKKAFLRNIIIILIFVGSLITVATLAYAYISNKVLKENIGDNLTSIINTTTYSVTHELEKNYTKINDAVNTITDGIYNKDKVLQIERKLELLNAKKDLILFPDNIHSGFGGFLEKEGKFVYYIDGIYYQDVNASYVDLDSADNITIFNFGNPNECKVEGGNVSHFNDTPYIIFKFNDIIVYADANSYFKNIITESDLVEFQNLFIIIPDGKITFTYKDDINGPFYEMLRSQFNPDGVITDVYNLLNNEEKLKPSYLSGVRFNGQECYLLAANISTDLIDTKLCVVELVTYVTATSPIEQALVPLIAAFSVIIIIILVTQMVSYVYLNKKSNDIDIMVYQRYNEAIFKIKIDRNGKILRLNKKMKNLLVDHTNFNSIKDFTFKEKYSDYVIAAITQKPLTIKLLGAQNITGNNMYLRCIVLRYFGNFIVTAINATEDENKNDSNLHLALYDPVTELPNLELFKADIPEYISRVKNSHSQTKSSLALIKIKNFKSFQTFYGKLIGDKIILEAKARLESLIDPRKTTLYYINDATFALGLEDLEEYEDNIELCKMLTEEFKRPIVIDSNILILDLIFSIYNFDLQTFKNESPEIIYESLIKLLEKVEGSVTSNIETYSLAVERFISSQEVLEQDLRNAIDNNEFEMYLQPQYDTEINKICGCEMLIRWNNPKYYHQSPAYFIQMAEQNGLIIQLGRFINETAMKIAKQLEPYGIDLSVNVSPVQILQAGFVQEFIDVAEKYEVNKERISLEITETFLMENFDIVNEKLKILKRYGFHIHLDDFCTGYSSMLYLKELPINAIKIDKEFTKFLNIDTYSRAIVNKIASLAKNLELDIIAEGVEDEKQVQFLSKNGCNIIQGYIISKAVPVLDFIALVEGYNINKTLSLLSDKKKK
ncbi:MAG: GGDEF domain-containing protein [Bacilli bacterium]|nr:GGDEF domain-containing protein [Bacilli bacterium]